MRLILICLLAFVSNTALSQDSGRYDFTAKTGVAVGSIDFVDNSGQNASGLWGGIPLLLYFNYPLSHSSTLMIGGGVLLDLKNSQLIRQGFGLGHAWHLIGGTRSFEMKGSTAGFETYSSKSLSLTSYASMQNFAASDPLDNSSRVTGSAFQVDLGIEYRHDFSHKNSLTVELLGSAFSLPASTSRVQPQSIEFLFGWRKFW